MGPASASRREKEMHMACQLAARASTSPPGTRKHPGKPGKNGAKKISRTAFRPGGRFTKAVAEIGSDDGPEGPLGLENNGFRATLTAPVRPHRPGEPPGTLSAVRGCPCPVAGLGGQRSQDGEAQPARSERRAGCPERTSGHGARAAPNCPEGQTQVEKPVLRGSPEPDQTGVDQACSERRAGCPQRTSGRGARAAPNRHQQSFPTGSRLTSEDLPPRPRAARRCGRSASEIANPSGRRHLVPGIPRDETASPDAQPAARCSDCRTPPIGQG